MGYESKLIVVNRFRDSDIFGEVIAEINLSCMGNEFFVDDVFTKELGKMCVILHGEAVTRDCYGKPLKYAEVDDVLRVLYKCEAEEHYRRTQIAIRCLECFRNSTDWADDKIAVVHYGY